MIFNFKQRVLLYASKLCMLCCFILSHFNSNAQSVPTRRYTSRDGLITDRITVITQDEKGYMWMGSLFGLCKYDGKKFTTISLPASQKNKTVSSLLAVDNKVFAGFLFGGGLMEYDNGRINTYTITDATAVSKDISGLYGSGKGIIVVNPYNQVYRFDNNKFRLLFSLDTSYGLSAIQSITDDGDGKLWVGTNRGLLIYENGRSRTILANQVISYTRKTQKKGIIIVSSQSETKKIQLINYGNDGHLQTKLLWESRDLIGLPFYSYHPNSFWAVDAKKGLLHVSENGDVDFPATTIDGQTEIKYLFADRENNLWLATDPGVLKIADLPFVSYLWQELALGGADILQTNDTGFYSTNSKHLYYISNNRITKLQEFRSGNEQEYLGILFKGNDGTIWVSAWNQGLWNLNYRGTQLISKRYFKTYQDKIIKVNCSTSDRSGNIWVAGVNGIFHIRNGIITDHFDVPVTAASTAFITAIAVDDAKNILWVGDNTGGLFKISYHASADKYNYEVIDTFGSGDGLSDTYVRSLLLDSKRDLWIGTRLGGIYLMNEEDENAHRIRSLSAEAGITCTRVTDITEDKGHSVWFATCDGLLQYSLTGHSWKKYAVSDGLLGAEIFSVAIDETNRQVWSTAGEGVTSIQFKDIKDPVQPLINITGISVLGREDSTALFSKSEKRLSTNENSISFTFAAASYTDEKKVKYKYMLSGYDKDWSVPVETNTINYLSLPFGHYTFKVLAWNGREWSKEPATFSFYITRPFYKSPWFVMLLLSLLVTTFYLVRTYRLKQKLKLEKLRLNIARDLHDDIGSALGSINLLSENANRHLSNHQHVEEVAGVFQKIGYSAQTVLDSMDDIIWAINPEKDSLGDLLIRMREFAIPLLEAKDIKFDLDMHAGEEMKPSMELKRNLYLIFKEAITNIVRHSGCSYVLINVKVDSKKYEIMIKDNGRGFNVDRPAARNGLKNMRNRAVLSHAKLSIDSIPGAGTTIRLEGMFS